MDQARLKVMLRYDPDTGIFTRKTSNGGFKIGSVAGATSLNGYRNIMVDNKSYSAHSLAWLYVYGKFPEYVIDHINHERSDNRIENLRDVKHSINCKNIRLTKNNPSGVPGVTWEKERKRWRVCIYVDNKRQRLGDFTCFRKAIKLRKETEKLFGFHKNHGVA